jgi:hypothetical protein
MQVRPPVAGHNRLSRLCVAATSVVLVSVGPSLGQNVPIPCSAFASHAHVAGWKVVAPVMLDIDGGLFGPMVGTTLAVGSATTGGKLNEVLDRECGNRVNAR